MKKLKTLAALVAATALAFALAACSHDSDSDSSGGTGGNTPTVRTYSEASDEEKARFAIAYDADKLKTLSQGESELTDAITVKASIPWRVEQYGDDWDSWAILSVEKSDATVETESKISLTIEDNLAEYYASLTENDDGTVDTSRAVMPEDRTTTLHFLTVAGKQLAAVTLTQTGDVPSGEAQTRAVASNHDFLGKGYNIFTGRWADVQSVKARVIDLKKLQKANDGEDPVTLQPAPKAEATTCEGKTLTELSNSFKINGSVSTQIFKFSAEVKAAYGNDYKETGSEEYAICYYAARKGIYSFDYATAVDGLIDDDAEDSVSNRYLNSTAYKAIYGLLPKYQGSTGIRKLIETYGTHVVVSGVVGARREFTLRMQKNEKTQNISVSAMAKAGYKGAFASGNVSVESSYENDWKEASQYCTTSKLSVGGSTNLELTDKEWEEALTDANAALVDFTEDSLVPIWELCFDTERAKAIRKEVLMYGAEKAPTTSIVGQIVLESGKLVSASSYTHNEKDPAVGVIGYVGTGGKLGRANTAYVVGVKRGKRLQWATDDKKAFISIHNSFSDSDGMLNSKIWKNICDNASYDLPAFTWAENYGTTMGYTGKRWATGWFIPSKNELTALGENMTIWRDTLKNIVPDADYHSYIVWSSTFCSYSSYDKTADEYVYFCYDYNDYAGSMKKGIHNRGFSWNKFDNWDIDALVVYPIPLDELFDKE